MPSILPDLSSFPTRPGKRDALNVLILDDERFDRHRLARLCSGLDFPCVVSNAKSLHEFNALLEHESFGLILLDYALPDGTGLDALDMVRLSARNLNTALLMISGHGDAAEVAREAQNMGCSAFLTKDALTPDGFAEAVLSAIGGGPSSHLRAKQSYTASEVELLVSMTATRAAQDVKPMVSRMMRQLRDLRAKGDQASPHALRALEQNCMSLWAFLIESEREDGANLMADMFRTASQQGPSAITVKQQRPPSPFSARQH